MTNDFDDYDFEAILETLEPLYAREGAGETADFLRENNFDEELIEKLLGILAELHERREDAYFD
jgi:hypothetical protein